ncbi:MAG: nuclear transport factor 2 family protein [Bacteroidales bacterium]|jgi:ketosteroid isomerase-like protein|nr:nuclear transport factor 2 family protein [Bacteroidales bacterium]
MKGYNNMEHSIRSVLLILSSSLIITACEYQEKKIKKEVEIQEISRVIDNAIGWFKTKDFELSYNTFAQDSNLLEVHPDGEVVSGFEQFRKNSEIYKNPEFLYVRHEIWDQKINLSESGTTAWFFCMLNDISTWKGKQVGWENTRWTGTLEKRDGRWVIVQQHFSFACE